MRVLHLVRKFSELTETFIYDQILDLEQRGVHNVVLTLRRNHEDIRPFPRVRTIPLKRRASAASAVWEMLRRLDIIQFNAPYWGLVVKWLEAYCRVDRPDVVLGHFGPMGYVGARLSENTGIPLVTRFYGFDVSQSGREKGWRRRYESVWRRSSRVLALSHHMAGQLESLGCPRDILDVVPLSRQSSKIPVKDGAGVVRRLVSVGRLTEKKGHLDAVEAVALARHAGADVRLEIIGDGEMRGAIERAIERHNAGEWVTLVGAQPSDATLRRMANADALLLCSREARSGDAEGTPTVIVEAQTIGLPVVSTRHAGIPEMIPRGNQRLLADEGDVRGLAGIITYLATLGPSGIEEIVYAGRAFVEAHYSMTTVGARLMSALETTLASARPEVATLP